MGIRKSSEDKGEKLSPSTSSRMSRALNDDFSAARVHSDGEADSRAKANGAFAFNVDNHVYFQAGAYRPGTPLGDALLAHEPAHVRQSQAVANADTTTGRPAQSTSGAAQEIEADKEGLSVLDQSGEGFKTSMVSISEPSSAVFAGGLQLTRCVQRHDRFKVKRPEFLGPQSQKTFDTIEHRIQSAELLDDLLVFGPILIFMMSKPEESLAGGGYPLEEQARAVNAVPIILKNRILQDIDLLLVVHDNELSPEERQYWTSMRKIFGG
jgi:hypothetical protein